MRISRLTITLLTCVIIALTSAHRVFSDALTSSHSSPNTTPNAKPEVEIQKIPDIDILQINDEIKQFLDAHIAGRGSKYEQAQLLHQLFFQPYYLNIAYNSQETRTAQETFDASSGNCLSHASLFIASARYLGLKARFQSVKVPRSWEKEDKFYIVPGHINAIIKTPRDSIIAEFVATYSGPRHENYETKIISDKQAHAEYYNNIGMEALAKKDYSKALSYLYKATQTYKKVGFIWSNLGVTNKILGRYEEAERAYLKAHKLDKHNLSIINNLHIYYEHVGNRKAANKFAKKAEKYRRKNPYYLAQLAEGALNNHNFTSAEKYLNKAIRIKGNEENFYLSLASVYLKQENYSKAQQTLKKAKGLSGSSEANRYQQKLDALRSIQASNNQ